MKKGVADVLVSIILVLVVSGVLVAVVGPGILAKLKGVGDREQCRASAVVKAQIVSKNLAHTESPTNLQCKTQEIEITHKAITKQGKRIETLSWGDNAKNEASLTAIKRTLANEMYDCWYQFKGLDIFGDWNSNLRCVPCSRVHITPEAKERLQTAVGAPGVPSMYGYLESTRIPNSEQTYIQYLTNGAVSEVQPDHDAGVDLSEDLYILYETSKSSQVWQTLTLGLCGVVSCGEEFETATQGAGYRHPGMPSVVQLAPAGILAARTGVNRAITPPTPNTVAPTFNPAEDTLQYIFREGDSVKIYRYQQVTDGFVRTEIIAENPEWAGRFASNPQLIDQNPSAWRSPPSITQSLDDVAREIDEFAPLVRSQSIIRGGQTAATLEYTNGFRLAEGTIHAAVVEGRTASLWSRAAGGVLRQTSRALWFAQIGFMVYDVVNRNDPTLSVVEIAPISVVTQCDQFY
ncbi:hypothetical protein J4464_00470 [Candidatus Woesearchaeota archaeon]|nr:hypothetical protein [Candidatus Woesearchaeota archaeon]